MKKRLQKKIEKSGYDAILNFYRHNPVSVPDEDIVMFAAWRVISGSGTNDETKMIQTADVSLENLSYAIESCKDQSKVEVSPIISGKVNLQTVKKKRVEQLIKYYDAHVDEIRDIARDVTSEFAKDYKRHLIRTTAYKKWTSDFPYSRFEFAGHDTTRIILCPNKHWVKPIYYYDITDFSDGSKLEKLRIKWGLTQNDNGNFNQFLSSLKKQ